MTFRCGHPREPGNTYTYPSSGYQVCALCRRIRSICEATAKDQQRINEGRFYTLGQRIARDIA